MKNPITAKITIFTLGTITLLLVIASFFFPTFNRVSCSTTAQYKQINNAREIAVACNVYAADHNGQFPEADPATSAEAHFNILFQSKHLDAEKLFWTPQHRTHFSPVPPNENGVLEPGENCWDYIAGLTNNDDPTLPLLFEHSDNGAGKSWTQAAGHPWETHVIVARIDGSAERVQLDEFGQAKVTRGGTSIDLCLPTPGKNHWPASARLAPATPTP